MNYCVYLKRRYETMNHLENSIVLNSSVDDHELGKFAIATRDFSAGDEILMEKPFLCGPISEPKSPLCLGCGVNVDCSNKCNDCGWPICRDGCDELERHRTNECEIFKKSCNMSFQRLTSKKGSSFHQYDCILPLRLLLFIEKYPDQWKCIEELSSFEDVRRDEVSWVKEEVYIVKYIRQKCKYKKFDEEFIHKICGILNAHSFHLNNSKNSIRCMYNYSHRLSHSCVPNTTFVIVPSHDFRIYIRASMNIQKGEKLSCSKTKVILPTLLRRQELVQNSYFSCCCIRCDDVTELQSHFSSLKCPNCTKGFILSENSLDFEADWACNFCKFKRRYTQLKKIYNEVEKELNKIQSEPLRNSAEKCELLLKKYESVFHFNHAFIVYLKYFSLSLSLSGDRFHSCDAKNIDQKIQRLYEILQVFDLISPGFTLLRGTTFHLLYKAYVVKAKQYDSSENPDMFKRYMSKAMQFLDITEQIMVIGKPFPEHPVASSQYLAVEKYSPSKFSPVMGQKY